MSVVFDATTRTGKVLAIVVRFVDAQSVQQQMVPLKFLHKLLLGKADPRNYQCAVSNARCGEPLVCGSHA